MLKFLTAYWQNLVLVNYEVAPQVLAKYVPRGTELDYFQDKTYASIVAFNFNKNKFLGILPTVPSYSFSEVNLRFYVKREDKRAAVFIKEVVPSRIIAKTARVLYEEPYIRLPMKCEITKSSSFNEYIHRWGRNYEYQLQVKTGTQLHDLVDGSFEEFILEHYWGYTAQSDGTTVEYQVSHPRWQYYKSTGFTISSNLKSFYGTDFEPALSQQPHSVFVAEGSKVAVSFPRRFSNN
jgi:uncharacterized protein YqjF (DUF2071 family)